MIIHGLMICLVWLQGVLGGLLIRSNILGGQMTDGTM